MKNIRRIVSVAILIMCMTQVFAQAINEESDTVVRLGVMQGPTGFSSSMLGDFVGDMVQISVYPSPNEAVARLAKGELDMAALPANAAANLYNKGVGIKAIAIIGEGMLSVVGTGEAFDEASDETTNEASEEAAAITTINVPGAGGTPDHMAQLLYPQYEADYSVTAPAQLAQLVIAQKTGLAILPQPFVSMVLRQNPNIEILSDVQEKWTELTGQEQYPMSILVARSDYANENPLAVEMMKTAYKNSIDTILSDPETAGERIEELGIMKAAMATPAIAQCALVYKDGKAAKDETTAYYEALLQLAPDAIGGKLPDEGFWL